MTLDLLLNSARPGDLLVLLVIRGTVVFALASVLVLLIRSRASADVVRAVWSAAFAGFTLLSIGTLLLGTKAPGPTILLPLGSMLPAGFGSAGLTPTIVPAVVVWVWLCGLSAMVGRTVVGVLGRTWLSRDCRLVPTPAWLATSVSRIAAEQGVPRVVTLKMGAGLRTPVTWGVWRPVVFLPTATLQMDREHVRQILVHELEHIRRVDSVLLWVVSLVRAILWFHPLVAWAARDLRRAQEEACDDAAVRASTSPLSYARLLAEYGARLRSTGLTPHGATFLGRGTLEHRVGRLLRGESGRWPGTSVPGRVAVATITLVCGLLLTVGAAWSVTIDPERRTWGPSMVIGEAPFDRPTGLRTLVERASGSSLPETGR